MEVSVMKKEKIRQSLAYLISILILFSLILPGIVAAQSNEGLLLAGVVRSIAKDGRSVVIDVQNKGCHGIMTFSIGSIAKYGIVAGDRVDFMVESATCPKGTVTRITDLAKVVPMNWRVKR